MGSHHREVWERERRRFSSTSGCQHWRVRDPRVETRLVSYADGWTSFVVSWSFAEAHAQHHALLEAFVTSLSPPLSLSLSIHRSSLWSSSPAPTTEQQQWTTWRPSTATTGKPRGSSTRRSSRGPSSLPTFLLPLLCSPP
ncbi:hypothetical protein GW17_00048429 [Ensete ventricosum]|nr:hypothetical protein GW17_00048429 [Ensete ventricosum]